MAATARPACGRRVCLIREDSPVTPFEVWDFQRCRVCHTCVEPVSETDLNQSQGGMYIYVTMMINCVAPVNLSHPYLENDPAPSVDPHRLRISPWL